MSKKVIIVGAGVAGMQSAITLSELDIEAVVFDKTDKIGGKLTMWDRLFPTMTPAKEVLDELTSKFEASGAKVRLNTTINNILEGGSGVELGDGTTEKADAVIIASGFDIFEAELKEEYGYGVYDNVITTVDLERMFRENKVEMVDGQKPKTVAFLHCVGSRDEKVNQRHCSRVCCITGVKQAIEIKQAIPGAEVYGFYMDMRMFGPGYEELYRQAQQEYNIHFVRGRISEASQTIDGRVKIKAEDTLIGRPMTMTVDMLVLAVGMKAAKSNADFARCHGVELYSSNFIRPLTQFTQSVCSAEPRIFYAGTVTAPKNIGESINEGITAAYKVAQTFGKL
ncbi:MAG: FAD-dependent oxidoreductase [Mucinivorans sp.]